MSKVVKGITKAVTGIFTGGSGGGPGALGQGRFKGSTRKIDADAFKIKKADSAANQSRRLTDESEVRSKKAQGDRSKLITDLQAQADGSAPSLAEAQLKSASDRSLAQQLAASQSQRGGSASSRERNLLRNQATAGRELAQDSATARLQERQQAQSLLGDQIGQEQQLADSLIQNYLTQGFTIEQAQQQAQADFQKSLTAQHLQAQGLTAQGFEGAAGRRAEMGSNMMSGASSMFSMLAGSDKKFKKKIKKTSSKEMEKALSMSSGDSKKNVKSGLMKESKQEKEDFKHGVARRLGKKDRANLGKTEKQVGKEKTAKIQAGAKAFGDKIAEGGKKSREAGRRAFNDARPGTSFGSLLAEMSDEDSKQDVKKVQLKESKEPELSSEASKITSHQKKEKKGGMGIESLMKMAPMLAAMSDEDSKIETKAYSDKNIKKDFLDKLEAYTYEYKDKLKDHPQAGHGKYTSVMAQDLEKAGSIGKSMVKQDEETGLKVVDYGKGYGAILAAQAHLNKRLNELEKKKKSKK